MEIIHISKQEAIKLLSPIGWSHVKKGKVWYSRCGKWKVWCAGTFYKKQKCSPTW